MDIIQSFLLGLLQGLTEFLPISSSGHLALGRYFLANEAETEITFEVVVHFGTLCSIVLYYRKEIWSLIKAGFAFLREPSEKKSDPQVVMIGYILVSMIPAFIVGFTLKDKVEAVFMNPLLVSGMLVVTGVILFLTRFPKEPTKKLSLSASLLIGIAQSFAMIPGISRSGSTISTALYLGIRREDAANFSFLMVIPVIAGAMILQLKEMLETGTTNTQLLSLMVGFVTAFVSGYYALKYLIIILKRKGFHYFAYYCWIVGGAGLIYFLAQ